MQRYFSVAVVAITVTSFVFAQKPGPKDATKTIVIGKAEHDFGVAKGGGLLSHSFKLTNPHKVPMRIISVQTTNGAVDANMSKKLLHPGGTAELELRVDTSRFTGPKTVRAIALIEGQGLPPQKAEVSVSVNARP